MPTCKVLADAVEGAKGLDQDKIADWLRGHTFKTVMGDIKFGEDGELAESYSNDGVIPAHHQRRPQPVQHRRSNRIILWPDKVQRPVRRFIPTTAAARK